MCAMPGTASLRSSQRSPSASDALAHVGGFGVLRHLKGKPRAARLRAALQRHHEVAVLGREIRPAIVALRHCQAGNLGEIGNLAFDVGRLEGDVTEPSGIDHGIFRAVASSSARRPSRPRTSG
jgi:hypothetical protein